MEPGRCGVEWFSLMFTVAGGEAGNPVGNPVIVMVPAGMRPGGRQTRLDLRRCAQGALARRVVSYF
jgi:hypothetical protein